MKHTKGEWYIDDDGEKVAKVRSTIHKEGKGICLIYPNKEWEANAKLIVEAGNVTNETGYTPRQLAEQKAELLEALKTIKGAFYSDGESYKEQVDDLKAIANEAIKKAIQ